MKTPAVIASLTVAGSIAFAAGQQSGGLGLPEVEAQIPPRTTANPRPSWEDLGAIGSQRPGVRPRSSSVPCPVEDLNWLSPLPHFAPACVTTQVSGVDVYAADINGDGSIEHFAMADQVQFLGNSLPLPYSDILLTQAVERDGLIEIQAKRVLSSAVAGAAIRSAFPNCSQFEILVGTGWGGYHGWRDMDNDGDLDLASLYVATGLPSGIPPSGVCWFENVGHEKHAPPIAADINGDGRVDGADLGLLLVAWGPNP
jgi:hypothetical protein